MTEDDLYAMPDDGQRYELQAGLLLSEPPPTLLHGRVHARLIGILGPFVESHGIGQAFGLMGFVLARDPDTIRGADISFIAREHLDLLGDGTRWASRAPDLAVEVVSTWNHPEDIRAKVADFLEAGSRLVWVVDPQSKSVTVYRTLLAPCRLGTEATLEGGDVVPGFSVPVATIFDE